MPQADMMVPHTAWEFGISRRLQPLVLDDETLSWVGSGNAAWNSAKLMTSLAVARLVGHNHAD